MVSDERFLHFWAKGLRTSLHLKSLKPPCCLAGVTYLFFPGGGFVTAVILATFLMVQTAASGSADTGQAQTSSAASVPVISDRVRYSLLDHPSIQTGRARTCQAIHRLGIQRAEFRPQISGSINSERQVFGHFKSSNNQGERDRAEARALNRQESNVYDLEVSLRHTLWDWHVTDNRVRAHQIAYDVERLRLNISLSEQVLYLLKAALRLDFYARQVKQSQMAIADMRPYITAIEAQGEAGFVRLVDVRRALQSEIDVLRQEVESLNRSINEREAAARIDREQAAIFKEEYSMIKPLVDAGHEPRIKLIEAEKRLQESEGAAELAVLSINAMQSDLQTKQKQIVSVRQNYQAEVGTQLVEAQTRLSQALARKDALAGSVGYAEVKAPHTGTVSALHLKTVGAVVQPGTLLAEIVPEEKAVTIRANLKPENVADVYVGQIARISL